MTIVRRTLFFLVAVGLFATSALPAEAASSARAKLARSDATPGLQHADKLGRTDPHRQLTIGVNLALRNEVQLEAFIAQVSDRKSPNYGHYLTPDQFAATYGPTQSQVQQVVDQLRASGLSVASVSSNRTIVDATGPVSAVEAAFGVTISDWHDRDQNRDFFGNDTEPTLPAAIASYVVGVAGLNNHYPLHRLGPSPKVPPGGGPAGGYTPNDLKKAYDVMPLASAGYNGSGQPLGLFELDGFRQSNITTYDTQYGLGSPAPTRVLVSGGPGPLGGGEIEVELDIEVMHAIAPASPITVWEGPNSEPGANATYNAMVTSNTTKSNSTSWGICEPNTTSAEMTTLDNIFKQAAAQGQSFFAASGDNGAYDCGDSRLTVDSPANDPYMTGTGGTNLALNADSSYKSESAWSNPNTLIGTGGGVSGYFARPSWQTGPGVANTYSNGKRQVPDVALDADPQTGYSVYVTYMGVTGWNVVGGTSAAAPAWAAFTGVYNQYAAVNGKPNLGFANPTLYSAGSNAQPYPPYHDITTGDNLYYPAAASWDFASGWGSYDGYNFARDLGCCPALAGSQAPQGNWVGAYGPDGYALLGWNASSDLVSLPLSTVTLDQGARYSWNGSTSDVRALQGADLSTRRATCWFAGGQLRLHLNFPAAYSGTLHLYALDWDSTSRRETITVNDGSGPRTANLTTAFDQGIWVNAAINVVNGGTVSITVTSTAGANAVLSGLFLGAPTAPPANPSSLTATPLSSAQINLSWTGVNGASGYQMERSPNGTTSWGKIGTSSTTSYTDTGLTPTSTYYYRVEATNSVGTSGPSNVASATTTLATSQAPQGNWVGAYGSDGYALLGWNASSDLVSLPLSTVTLDQGARYSWNGSTSDVRALQGADLSTRRATCWFAGGQLRLHLNFPAAYSGTLHLYALDWDSTSRRETITVNDGSGPRTANLTTAFDQGIWVNAAINVVNGGTVSITVTSTAGANAVLSGLLLR